MSKIEVLPAVFLLVISKNLDGDQIGELSRNISHAVFRRAETIA